MRKKFMVFIVSLVVIFTIGFVRFQYLFQLNNLLSQEIPFLYEGNLNVYMVKDTYYVVIRDYRTIIKAVEFTIDRAPSIIVGLKLKEVNNIEDFLGKSIDEIKRTIGEIHAETGNGFYIPSYITKDGYLIKFWIEDGIVAHVSKIDLLSGECIEWYPLEE